MNLPAEKARQLPADGESQAGATVLAAGARVGLLEFLENEALLFLRNADARVGHLERHDPPGSLEHGVVLAPSGHSGGNAKPDAAPFGELERIREQVLKHLLQPFRIGDDVGTERRIDLHIKRQVPAVRFVPEWPRDRVDHAAHRHLLRDDRHRSRLDLGEVENVGDQVKQVGARPMNGLGELHLFRREVALGILAELLAEDKDAVERGAQLVRHVGQEVGLVFRRDRELGGLVFDRAAGLLDLLVLALDFGVLFRQLLRLLRELFVRLLQLTLLGLQLGRQLLRLLEQPLRLHGGFDAVEHDADARGELLEERQVRRGERAEGRQLDHGLDLVLEEHGQHDHVPGR